MLIHFLFYKSSMLTKSSLHASHHPAYIQVSARTPQPIYHKLGVAANEWFNLKHTSISTCKGFLTMRDELTCLTSTTFTLIAANHMK